MAKRKIKPETLISLMKLITKLGLGLGSNLFVQLLLGEFIFEVLLLEKVTRGRAK